MTIQRGEIYFVDLNPTQGREQSGKRPVLVLFIDEINQRPLVVTVVIGTKGSNISRDYKTNVRVACAESGLPLETVFLGFQLRSISPERFPRMSSGRLTAEKLSEIEQVVRYCLGL